MIPVASPSNRGNPGKSAYTVKRSVVRLSVTESGNSEDGRVTFALVGQRLLGMVRNLINRESFVFRGFQRAPLSASPIISPHYLPHSTRKRARQPEHLTLMQNFAGSG